jgi:hypothetical protein
MTLNKSIERLNWRLIATHFIATWFFMYSFETLAALHYTTLIDIYRHSNKGNLEKALIENNINASDLAYFYFWTRFGNTIGLLVAFIISLTISIRRKWFWFNSFIVLTTLYVLSRFDLLGWTYLKYIFLRPGTVFKSTTFEYLTNGIILLVLGLLTFFLTKTTKFIESNYRATK